MTSVYPPSTTGTLRADAGGIVFGWLARLTLTFALLGLAGFEVLSIAVTHVDVEDVGVTAADRALTRFADTHNSSSAYLEADAYATSHGAVVDKKTFVISEKS